MSTQIQPIILDHGLMPITETYQYERLPGPRSFRLLKVAKLGSSILTCTIAGFELGASPPFNALSYTWDSPIVQPEPQSSENTYSNRKYHVLCDNSFITVTENLFDALDWWADYSAADILNLTENNDLSDSAGSDVSGSTEDWHFIWLWVDAICIDQNNSEERSAQVLLMGKIYAAAQQVDVWLGKSLDDIEGFRAVHDELLPALWKLAEDGKTELLEEGHIPLDPIMMQSLGLEGSFEQWQDYWLSYFKFFGHRRWFRRAWVIQEVALAQFVVVRCGSVSFLWDLVCQMAETLTGLSWRDKLVGLSGYTKEDQESTDIGEVDLLQFFREQCRKGGFRNEKIQSISSRMGARTDQEHWFCYFRYVIREIRHYQATNPKDKLYAILGIVMKDLPESVDAPILPDYSLTTEEIYVSVASLLVLKVPLLGLLSDIGNRGAPETAVLPSWVPDYRLRDDRTPFVYQGVFKATGTDISTCRTASVVDNILHASGACFDTVVEVCPPMVNMIDSNMIQPCFELCLRLDPIYPSTKQDRVEVLWRTMIGDSRKHPLCYPAPKNLRTDFYSWVLYTTSSALMIQLSNNEQTDSFINGLSPIKDLLSADKSANTLLPSIPAIVQTASLYRQRVENPDTLNADDITIMNELLAKERHYYESLAVFIGGRSLYRTSNGFLGLGPDSMRVGDEVWALQTAQVPFVLRKVENPSSYSLVGEAYLHGFMQGEMLDADLQSQIGPISIL